MYKHNGKIISQMPAVPGLDGMLRWSKRDDELLNDACRRWNVMKLQNKIFAHLSPEEKKQRAKLFKGTPDA